MRRFCREASKEKQIASTDRRQPCRYAPWADMANPAQIINASPAKRAAAPTPIVTLRTKDFIRLPLL
jgi:hypothetical protein